MANIWADKHPVNNENSQYGSIRSKQMLAPANRNIHKLAFSEIKNVIHNQKYGATPIKGNVSKIDGLPNIFNSSKSLCNEVLRKQQMKQNFAESQNKLESKQKTLKKADYNYKPPEFDVSLFDSWDRNRECCRNHKSDEEIWSEIGASDMEMSIKLNPPLDVDEKHNLFECPADLNDLHDIPDLSGFQDFTLAEEEKESRLESRPKKLFSFDAFFDEIPF